MVLELSKVKESNQEMRNFLRKMEAALFEKLSRLLFGNVEIEEYEDLKLPSEDLDREEDKPVLKGRVFKKRRRSVQLQLLFFRPVKRLIYGIVLSIERLSELHRSKRQAGKFCGENTYRGV